MLSRITTLCCCFVFIIPLAEASAQTRFVRPDTSPNYASYRHADECVAAINRLDALEEIADSVWSDTLERDTLQYLDSASPHIANVTQACLAKMDVDSIPYKNARLFLRALLLANRDTDVQRMFARFKDQILFNDSLGMGISFIKEYLEAKPARIDKADSLLHIILPGLPPDSVGNRIDYLVTSANLANRIGNRTFAAQKAREAIAMFDTLSDKYKSRFKITSYNYAYENLAAFLTSDAQDSLRKSTDAYRNYLAHLWTSITGEPAGDYIGPIAMQAPQLTGQYWYSNRNGTIQKIAPITSIETGSPTIVYFVQAGCHSHYGGAVSRGRNNGYNSDNSISACWEASYHIRRMMERYPTLKLVLVSKTFGSFADAPPLTPEQEADTLAQYFLGFRKLKGIHVISETEFFRLQNYDNRIIDLPTENELAYDLTGKSLAKHNTVLLVDELGKIFYFGAEAIPDHADARLKAVMERPANRSSQ